MMIAMPNWTPVVQNPMQNMIVDAIRTILPTLHTQMNQARLSMLQVRQAAITATKQSIEASLETDKQLFELAQAMIPIAHKQAIRTRLSLLEVQEASILAMNQAMEQSMKTDQQLYDACLELLNKNSQPEEAAAEDTETEVEVEVVPDEEIFGESAAAEN